MSIQQRWYKITLKSPVIFSEKLATTGQHITLDFIPGRVLLGLAARLYPVLGEDAWTAFHSGQIRFIDGLPCTDDGQRSIPTPRCLQQEKRRSPETIINQAAHGDDSLDRTQFVALNSPYIFVEKDETIRKVALKKLTTMKTAVDSSRGGVARDGHLFGYQALSPGQQFIARIDADPTVSERLLNRIEGVITGERRIGASRTAEFGAVSIERIEAPTQDQSQLREDTQTIRVVLLSDLALVDDLGQPRLAPEAADFGLPPDWTLDLARTFIRHRRYDRYNAARKSHDIKRHVLSRGAVITFNAPDGKTLNTAQIEEAMSAMQNGVGLDRQEGLGQFFFEPPWISSTRLTFAQEGPAVKAPQASPPTDDLFAFVSSQSEALSKKQLDELSEEARELSNFCAQCRGRAPSKTQWSRIRRWARQGNISNKSLEYLVGGTKKQSLSKGWQIPYRDTQLGYHLVELGKKEGSIFLSELAHLVRIELDRKSSLLEEEDL